MKHRIHDTIFLTLILGVAFMLPVWGRIVPPLIVLLVVNWLVDGRTWTNAGRILKRRSRAPVLWFGSLYLLYWVGMLYTADTANGFFDMEVKLSLLLFPVIFSLAAYPVDTPRFMRLIFAFFIAGCVTGAVSLLIRAGYRYQVEGASDAFYYTGLSWHFHASYLAMYYNLAIAILLIQLPEKNQRRTWYWYTGAGLSLVLMVAMIFMLASKAGIASFGLVIVAAIAYVAARLKNRRILLGMATLSVVILSAGFILSPGALNRMTAAGKTLGGQDSSGRSVSESSADRLVAWKTALEIIRQHPLTGVGTGDVRREITSAYQAHHDISAFEQKLNAHNQFLQTALALGIPGLMLLLAMLFVPGWLALRQQHDLYLLFILLFGFNMLVESMFEVQAGILFYALFNTLFFIGMKNGDPFARTPA